MMRKDFEFSESELMLTTEISPRNLVKVHTPVGQCSIYYTSVIYLRATFNNNNNDNYYNNKTSELKCEVISWQQILCNMV